MSSPQDAASSVSGFQGVQIKQVLLFPICRMSFVDWCKFFTEADVCRLINTSVMSVHKTWHEVVHFGSWTKNAEPLLNRCGGCSNHRQTFLQNPQVHTPAPTPAPALQQHQRDQRLLTAFQTWFQYLFDITKEADEVLISLQQKDLKILRKVGQGENLSIGFTIFKVANIPKFLVFCWLSFW